MKGSEEPYNRSTYYSDEESQDAVESAYNPSAVGFNAADESNEYRVDPQIPPNTPVYHPTKSVITHDDEDFESLSTVGGNRHKKDMSHGKMRCESDGKCESLSVESASNRGVASIVEEDEEFGIGKPGGAVVADDDRLDIFDEGPDDDKDDKQGGDFEGFDGDETGAKDMIADIFGESDAEGDGDFEGFAENEVEREVESSLVEASEKDSAHHHHLREHHPQIQEDESEVEGDSFVSDFELISQRMRNERRRRRGLGKEVTFLNDADDIIRDTINRMRDAAEQDRKLLSKNRPATKKLSMLNTVDNLLIRADIFPALIDNGILSAIAEWLSPVSGRTLPSISIRECLLKHLKEFNIRDSDLLKESGLGKAVMFIYRHPKETLANRRRAYSLITSWSRPVFNLPIDYSSLSKEERKEMDFEHLRKRPRETGEKKSKKDDSQSRDFSNPLKPGDPGFVPRARVPQPSNRDYVVRPKWNVPEESIALDVGDGDVGDGPSTSRRQRVQQLPISSGVSSTTRIERQIRALSRAAAARKKKRFSRASKMSIEGRNMSL